MFSEKNIYGVFEHLPGRERACPQGKHAKGQLTCVHGLLDGNEAHRQCVLDIDELHVHQHVPQVTLGKKKRHKACQSLLPSVCLQPWLQGAELTH